MHSRSWIALVQADEEVVNFNNGVAFGGVLGEEIHTSPTISAILRSDKRWRGWGLQHQITLLGLNGEQGGIRRLLGVLLLDCLRKVENQTLFVLRWVVVEDGYGHLQRGDTETVAWVCEHIAVFLLETLTAISETEQEDETIGSRSGWAVVNW